MSCSYKPNCQCSNCRSFRRSSDYRADCECTDCSAVRREVCPAGGGQVGSCKVEGRSCYTEGDCGCQCRGSCRCGG